MIRGAVLLLGPSFRRDPNSENYAKCLRVGDFACLTPKLPDATVRGLGPNSGLGIQWFGADGSDGGEAKP